VLLIYFQILQTVLRGQFLWPGTSTQRSGKQVLAMRSSRLAGVDAARNAPVATHLPVRWPAM